jgi:dienelactone hydrolase
MTLDCSQEYFADFGDQSQLDFDVIESTVTLDLGVECPDLFGEAEGNRDVLVRRPTTDLATEAWPSPAVPWVVFQHGNGLDEQGYEHIVNPLVESGFAVFLPDGPSTESPVDRSARIQCVARWADTFFGAELGSCFALAGHSNGAQGAWLAARDLHLNNDPLAARLGAVAALAPRGPDDLTTPLAEQATPLLVLSGSHDHDVTLGPSELYEVSSNEGAYDLQSGLAGSVPGRTGEKVFVEAYDVAHGSLGGVLTEQELADPFDPAAITAGDMLAKGRAVARAYVPAFLFWQIVGIEAFRPRFSDNEHPSSLSVDDAWWDYFPQWSAGDPPLVFSSYQMGDKRGVGIERYAVATMEGIDGTLSYPGEADVGAGAPAPSLVATAGRQDALYDLYSLSSLTSTSFNNALRVDWNASAGGIQWFFPPPDFTPTHLSIRAHNVFDGWASDEPDCIPELLEEPLSIGLRLADANGAVVGATFDDVVVQDHIWGGDSPHPAVGPQGCDTSQSLYTIRVPISCMALEEGSLFQAGQASSVELRFGETGPVVGSMIVDSIELTRAPEDVNTVSPDCRHLGPPVTQAASYACIDYEPSAYVDFTRAESPGPGEAFGASTFSGGLGRFIAGRPKVLTDCDDARYELTTVSADSDADGVPDGTFDVRNLENVSSTDLVALLGLENGDAAVTLNEPGKPSSNGVELYDFGSFVEAYRRFGALQDIEVRLLREQPGGLHEPVLLDAYVPPGLSGVEPPEPPAGPSAYTLPTGATTVSSSADLVAELALPNAHDIIVADGDYTWTGPVTVAGPHRVWSNSLHGATLHFGLTYAGNADRTDGLELHGLDFQLDDASMAPAGVGSTHVLFTWGQGGEDVLVEDCAFDGDLVIGDAIGSFAPNGLVVRRSTISNFWSYGIIAKQGGLGTVLASEPLLEDLQIQSIFGANPGASNGAQENGILLGNNGTIRRVDIRDVGWSAILLYNDATGVSIEDVFLDYAGPDVWSTSYTSARGAGIWLSHSHDVTIDRVRIESHVFLGINAHWDLGSANPFTNTTPPRNHNITISNLYSRTYKIGVHLDLGVEDTVVRSSRFEHAWMAGVLDNNRFEDDWNWHPCPGGEEVCLESPNRTESIDCYLQDGVDCVAHHHNGGATTTPPTGWVTHPDAYTQPGGLLNRNNAALPGPGSGTSGSDGSETGQWGSSSN